jgi:zinc protease
MKHIYLSIIFSLLIVFPLFAQLDRSQRPEPGPAPVIQLGDVESFMLDNGLHVIVVENHKVPIVSFQLSLDIDPVIEGKAKGYVELGGALLREGTTNRTKKEIDDAIDFIGAVLSTGATSVFGSSLSRHKETLLDLMSDILLNPSFPESELQRMVTQSISGLATVPSDAGAMAQNVATRMLYGSDHPYGEVITEESLKNISVEQIREYYRTYFRPNVAYLVIVGDISVGEAREVASRYFGNWKPAEVPTHTYPVPKAPSGRKVAFANRAGAVQSLVRVTYPVELQPGSPDAIKASVMNAVLGGGAFSGRLMQNLREDKGYTYGAGSSLSSDRIIGRFSAGAEVRNNVTDSTLTEIFYEMERLIREPVNAKDLELTKNYMTGTFARSLENPRTIAGFALNIARYDLPEDYYATYLEKLNAVSPEEVQQMAAKYLTPDQAIVVVAGNKEEVAGKLIPFSADQEVLFFDAFGHPLETDPIRPVPEGTTVETVLNKYFDALGGKEALHNIRDISREMTASVMGQQITIKSLQKAPNLRLEKTFLGSMIISQQLFDGQKAVIVSQMGRQELTDGPEFEQIKTQSTINQELNYKDLGIRKHISGIERIDGVDAYKVEVHGPSGFTSYEYYALDTGLKIKMVSESSTVTYADYRRVNGVLFPHKMLQQAGPQLLEMNINSLEINTGLEKEVFIIQ